MKLVNPFLLYLFLFSGVVSSCLAGSATVVITVFGSPKTIFDHSERCEAMDLPDEPLRAFRRADNSLVAFSTHYLNRRLIGPSLSKLSHDCRLVYEGRHLANPAMFDDRTWIAATWTDDGIHVNALGHNEYQAEKFRGRCAFSTYYQCWYNAIVPLQSSDGGFSFSRSEYPMPVAAASIKNDIEQGHPRGYFSPSNIINWRGFYYTLVGASHFADQRSGRCLFRTKDTSVADSWTSWDGIRFTKASGSPYDRTPKASTPCVPVTGITGFLGSIALIDETQTFVAFSVAEAKNSADGGYVDAAFSEDLLHWHGTQHVMSVTPAWSKGCPSGGRYSYPSVLSDSDRGRNFQSLGKQAFLFLVRSSCVNLLKRSLERFTLKLDRQ